MIEDHIRLTIDTYNQISQSYIDTTSAIRPQLEFEEFVQIITPQGKILDVGSAWGRDVLAFNDLGFRAIGIDLSIGMLLQARRLLRRTPLIHTDLRRLPLVSESVDGIWCCATLLHLRRDEVVNALAEFKRVLKNGAYCYVQVKKGVGEEVVGGDFSKGKPRFFSYFHESELRNFFLSLGYNIINEHIYNERDRHGPNSRDQEQLCFLVRKV